MSYIARKSCGCLVAAVVDDPAHSRDVARVVSQWIRDDLTVERVESDIVRREFTCCPHEEINQLNLFEGENHAL